MINENKGLGQNKGFKLMLSLIITQSILILTMVLFLSIKQMGASVVMAFLVGGLVNVIVQVYSSYRMLRSQKYIDSGLILKNLLQAELMKFVFVILSLSFIIIKVPQLTPTWLIIGFIVAQVGAVLSPMFVKKLYA